MRVMAGVVTHCAHGQPLNGSCPRCAVGYDLEQQPLVKAARALAAGKVRYAEAFLRFKLAGHQVTDGQAHQQAIVETKGELDVLQALYELERSKL